MILKVQVRLVEQTEPEEFVVELLEQKAPAGEHWTLEPPRTESDTRDRLLELGVHRAELDRMIKQGRNNPLV